MSLIPTFIAFNDFCRSLRPKGAYGIQNSWNYHSKIAEAPDTTEAPSVEEQSGASLKVRLTSTSRNKNLSNPHGGLESDFVSLEMRKHKHH